MAHQFLRKPFCVPLDPEHVASSPSIVHIGLKDAVLNLGLFIALTIDVNQSSKR